jgi:hypothetical protein
MVTRQTRVFVKSDEPLADWAETLMGKVFRPLTTEFAHSLNWYWFSRYEQSADDSGDCDVSKLPTDYKQPIPGYGPFHRSMRLRFSVSEFADVTRFERRAEELIFGGEYWVSDFRDYDFIADTGNNRFLGVENRERGKSEKRALAIVNFYHATSALVLDALVGPNEAGRFRMETNDERQQNPRGSTFQSLLHLFCNITNAPTDVYVYQKAAASIMGFGTFMYPPPSTPDGGWDETVTVHSIRY